MKHPIETASQVIGSQRALAAALGVTKGAVWQWTKDGRSVPIRHCHAIERITNGAVTRKDLRPHDWRDIWPELVHGHLDNAQRADVDAVFAANAGEVSHG